ncbi:bactofilin family protein [Marinivivus vitaminiproducens]|uniref:bactofilin family protein n=1 Tax=Marinivivus vitaminiproducens TaxID=3035935 RepID=UPI00279942D1|nr:polymer-forming cytoskeletal protein [Geminicoccaceae bacterium SCSIO 64248]
MFRKKDEGVVNQADITRAADVFAKPSAPVRKLDAVPSSALPAMAIAKIGGEGKMEKAAEPVRQKRLTVGDGIRMSGEITACDRLVVEGHVEARLNETLALEIAETGHFKGGCEVEEAEITGCYEGDLIVRNRLLVRATGRVHGNIQYGEIEVERGGQVSGTVGRIGAAKSTLRSVDKIAAQA